MVINKLALRKTNQVTLMSKLSRFLIFGVVTGFFYFTSSQVILSETSNDTLFDLFLGCMVDKDLECAAHVASDVAVSLKQQSKIRQIPTEGLARLPSTQLKIWADLSVYYSLEGDIESAKHFFRMAYPERIGSGAFSSARPINAAVEWLIYVSIVENRSKDFHEFMNFIEDFEGNTAKIDRKILVLHRVVRRIEKFGKQSKSGYEAKIISEWIKDQADSDSVSSKFISQLILDRNFSLARRLLAFFPSQDLQKIYLNEFEKLKSQEAIYEKITSELVQKNEKALHLTMRRYHEKGKGVSEVKQIVRELQMRGRYDLVPNFMSTALNFAREFEESNCRIVYTNAVLEFIVSSNISALQEHAIATLPTDLDSSTDHNCEGNIVEFNEHHREIFMALMFSPEQLATLSSESSFAQNSGEIVNSVYGVVGATAPNLDQKSVTLLLTRLAELRSMGDRITRSRQLVFNAGIARQYGYDLSAFDLLAAAIFVATDASDIEKRQLLVTAINALFSWRHQLSRKKFIAQAY